MAEEYKVVRVVDGDTIDVRSGLLNTTTRVRLLNVDAPETVDPEPSGWVSGSRGVAAPDGAVAQGFPGGSCVRRRAN
jgi:endonuclease YncB( thermonuclease family)